MNIIVCIKQVPDTTKIKLNPVTGTLIRQGVSSIINPDDKAGLEEALKLKDLFGCTITALTMGPLQAKNALQEAFSMGVDKGILLTDKSFSGSDSLATSTVLASAIKKLDYDIIITGRQAIDGDTAQVGPQLAEHLDLPQISYVKEVKLLNDYKTLELKRSTERCLQVLQCETPCLITVLSTANTPRYMNVSNILNAVHDKKIEVWDASVLDVDYSLLGLSGSPTKVHKSFTKGAKSIGTIHNVEPMESVKILIDALKEHFII